jgi:hypothetical protein
MRIKIGLLVLSSTLAASNVAGHADTYNFIVFAAATSTAQGPTFDIATPTGKRYPRIPSAVDLTSVTSSGQEYGFTGVILLGTDHHTKAHNDLLYIHPTTQHVDSEEDLLYLDSSVGISPAHLYNNDGYPAEVFDPHDSVEITPFTIGFFRLTPIAIPEPYSLMLFGIGILSLAAIARRRFRRL